MAKGICRQHIEQALTEEYFGDETTQISKLLHKKHYQGEGRDTAEFRKIYQYLLRRGFRSSDILKEMDRMQKFL
jgi:regulatory protein